MTLLLSNDDVRRVLDMGQTIEVLEAAYRDLAHRDAVCRPRIDIRIPTGEDGRVYQWGTMEGGSARSGYFAIRAKSDVLYEQEYAGVRTQEKFCVKPGLYCGLVLLFSVRNGEPLAIINDGYLQHWRVGADSAIGARFLAREDARVLGMLGSGGMARSHLEAFLRVRPIEQVRVFSPTPANRERYAAEMAEQYGLRVEAVDDPRLVHQDVDILAGCTDAAGEVVRGEWLQPGVHVTCIGGRPDAAAYRRFDRVLRLGNVPPPDNESGYATFEETVSYRAQPDAPVWQQHTMMRRPSHKALVQDRLVTLADLLTGTAPGRTAPEQITFSERGNIQGAQFFAVAGLVYERARALGLGRELPTEWLLQDIRD